MRRDALRHRGWAWGSNCTPCCAARRWASFGWRPGWDYHLHGQALPAAVWRLHRPIWGSEATIDEGRRQLCHTCFTRGHLDLIFNTASFTASKPGLCLQHREPVEEDPWGALSGSGIPPNVCVNLSASWMQWAIARPQQGACQKPEWDGSHPRILLHRDGVTPPGRLDIALGIVH